MAWVIGGGIALLLFCAFPKQMFAILGVLIALGVGIFFVASDANEQNAKQKAGELASVAISASGSTPVCSDPKYPVLVTFQNRSPNRTLNYVSFGIHGYRNGFSSSVVNASYLTSDKILAPGQVYSACWPIPSYSGAPPPGETYQTLRWEVSKDSVRWQ